MFASACKFFLDLDLRQKGSVLFLVISSIVGIALLLLAVLSGFGVESEMLKFSDSSRMRFASAEQFSSPLSKNAFSRTPFGHRDVSGPAKSLHKSLQGSNSQPTERPSLKDDFGFVTVRSGLSFDASDVSEQLLETDLIAQHYRIQDQGLESSVDTAFQETQVSKLRATVAKEERSERELIFVGQ
jgi:hypothetical protein